MLTDDLLLINREHKYKANSVTALTMSAHSQHARTPYPLSGESVQFQEQVRPVLWPFSFDHLYHNSGQNIFNVVLLLQNTQRSLKERHYADSKTKL